MKQLSDTQKAKLDKLNKNRRSFIGEFKEFINKGSVMELAVGVIIGGAFTTIVNSLVNDILVPIISLIGGGVNFSNLSITIPNFFGTGDQAIIAYGNFIQNVVNFVLIAFCVFIIVKTLNNMRERAEKLKKKEEKKAEEKKEDPQIVLLTEIRDFLKKSQKSH